METRQLASIPLVVKIDLQVRMSNKKSVILLIVADTEGEMKEETRVKRKESEGEGSKVKRLDERKRESLDLSRHGSNPNKLAPSQGHERDIKF